MAKKYIDADLLKKEMEKRMHICDGVFERGSDTYYQGKAVAYQETLSFINSLQQEQPCDTCTNDKGCVTCKDGELWEGKEQQEVDLEAEINSFWNKVSGFSPKFTTLEVKRNGLGVIASHFANWQKEQMLKEAVDGVAEELYNDGEIHCTVGVGTYFKPGDEVYVIKKEDKK